MIPPRRKQDFLRLLLIGIFLLQAIIFFRHELRSTTISQVISGAPRKEKAGVVSSAYRPQSRPVASTTHKATGARFAMGSMNDHETSYDYIAITNKVKYAKKHGYDMLWSFEPAEGYYGKDWDRLKEMERAIQGKLRGENAYEWIWWIDYDLIITNSSVTLDSIVEGALAPYSPPERDDIHMIITPDCFPVNSGSLMVRATPYALELFKEWWRQKEIPDANQNPRSLQDCLRDMVAEGTMGLDKKSTFVKQWQLNAFPEEIRCHQDGIPWQPGMFVIHFAGAWAHVEGEDPTGQMMRKYAPMAF